MSEYTCTACRRAVDVDHAHVCRRCGKDFCSLCMSLTPEPRPDTKAPWLLHLYCHRCDGVTGAVDHNRRRGVVEHE